MQNASFPLFVTEKALNTEKDHVEGFAAEVDASLQPPRSSVTDVAWGVCHGSAVCARWRLQQGYLLRCKPC